MMEDVEYKDKRINDSVTALLLYLITEVGFVMVWEAISIKGLLSCTSSGMIYFQVSDAEMRLFT